MTNVDTVVRNLQKAFDNSKEWSSNGTMVINSVLDLESYYVVTLVPKNMKPDDFFIDGRFKVNKSTGKIEPFSTDMDREKYLKALKNPFYVKKNNT